MSVKVSLPHALLIVALCWPLHAFAIGYPSFTTEIPGVQLWVLHTFESGFPEEGFDEGGNEFVRYCNGTQTIYVSSFSSPIVCKSESTGGGTYRIYLKGKDSRLSGLVVVSKRPLPNRAQTFPIMTEESERLRKAEEAPTKAFANEDRKSFRGSSADYEAMVREIKTGATYLKHGSARFKLASPNGFIYILAIGLVREPLGWDIRNVVFREIDGRLQQIGDFIGCIEGFQDVDGDGTPEVLTRLCSNSEGHEDKLWSLTPTIRPVVMRSQ